MTRVLRELERIESRILGALRFVDASTGLDLTGPLELLALEGDAVFVRNPSGLRVLVSWTELADHEASFREPPAVPAPGSRTLTLSVTDPTGDYLTRRVGLALPRDPDPEAGEDSLFRPRVVPLFPSPRSRTGTNWSVLRVSLTEEGSGDALGGAFVRVRRDGATLARGLTDGRGEALVAAVGIPLLTFGEGDDAVVVDEVAVTVEACFDPDSGTRMPAAAREAGERPPVPEPDPDALEERFDSLPRAALPLAVAARRSQAVPMAIELP